MSYNGDETVNNLRNIALHEIHFVIKIFYIAFEKKNFYNAAEGTSTPRRQAAIREAFFSTDN